MGENIDQIQLNFSEDTLIIMNVLLGFVMFGVALGIRKTHFIDLIKNPKLPTVGFISQFILLPAFTFLMVMLLLVRFTIN